RFRIAARPISPLARTPCEWNRLLPIGVVAQHRDAVQVAKQYVMATATHPLSVRALLFGQKVSCTLSAEVLAKLLDRQTLDIFFSEPEAEKSNLRCLSQQLLCLTEVSVTVARNFFVDDLDVLGTDQQCARINRRIVSASLVWVLPRQRSQAAMQV